jgi:hypothetical protein
MERPWMEQPLFVRVFTTWWLASRWNEMESVGKLFGFQKINDPIGYEARIHGFDLFES